MKASIITMTSTYNYGATLQAYALQEFLIKQGHECNLIDHMSRAEKHRRIKLSDLSRANLKMLPYKRKLERGYTRFECFYVEHMNMTSRYATVDELKASPPDSDVFISGSDQVWNPKDPKLDRFLLDFVPDDRLKISYAASMGNPNLPEDKKGKYVEALKRFDAISVREREAYNMIQPLTEKPVSINCDPAFLLNADEWRALEKPVKGLKPGEYVLCYMLHLPVWFNEWIKEVKKQTGKKIVFVGLNGHRTVFRDKYVRDAGPGEFLWLIDNADTVVSSSFHGNVFSLIFGKKLISTPDKNRPDRIHNLLRMFDENSREKYDPTPEYCPEAVDCKKIEEIAQAERERSKNYLMSVFGNDR